MKLYNFMGAPNSKRVWLYVKQRRLPVDIVEMDVMSGALSSPEYLEKNPFALVPVLEIEPGAYLRESIVIVEYLEERFGASSLFGDTMLERARIREMERMFDMYVMSNIGLYAHNVAPFFAARYKQSTITAEQSLISLDKAAAIICGIGIGKEYLLFDKLTVADLTAYAVLEFCEKCEATGWHAHTPLLDWYRNFQAKADALAPPFMSREN